MNQLPSAFLATVVAHGRAGGSFYAWYIAFYIASNVLGLLLMLVSVPELRRKWSMVTHLYRSDRKQFVRVIGVDLLTFAAFLAVGSQISHIWL